MLKAYSLSKISIQFLELYTQTVTSRLFTQISEYLRNKKNPIDHCRNILNSLLTFKKLIDFYYLDLSNIYYNSQYLHYHPVSPTAFGVIMSVLRQELKSETPTGLQNSVVLVNCNLQMMKDLVHLSVFWQKNLS